MARKAHIIRTVRDAFGDLWDLREERETEYGWPLWLGWPHAVPRGRAGSGGPRCIPTAELISLLEKHRLHPSKIRLPCSIFVVKRLRKMLGHNYYSDGSQWWEDHSEELASGSLTEFARRHGVQTSTASIWHTRMFGKKNREPGWWHTKDVAELLLSEAPKTYKADKLGCSVGAIGRLVWATRQRLGIKLSIRDRRRIIEENAARKRGKPAHPNTKAALLEASGRPKELIHRYVLGISNGGTQRSVLTKLRRRGFTLQELADAIGCSRQNISQLVSKVDPMAGSRSVKRRKRNLQAEKNEDKKRHREERHRTPECGRKFREMRAATGLTAKAFGDLLGLSAGSIYQIEMLCSPARLQIFEAEITKHTYGKKA